MNRRFFLGILIVVVVGGVAVMFITQRPVFGAPSQPIAYSHETHVQAGIQCLYCHSEASRSPIAGIPSVQKCMGCHSAIATESELIQEIKNIWESGQAIKWNRVNDQPDFVYFSHQPHISAGLNCETCHGDVGSMDAARSVVRMDMGWCLECHEKQEPEKIARLVDCLICHK
jgi:hypothetical protein